MDIYVGNIAHRTTEDQLKAMFDPFGAVTSVKIMKDKITGESRGFGFVRMADAAEAEAAIAGTNGQTCDGRSLRVNEARPMERTEGGPRNSFGGGSSSGHGGNSGYRNNRY